MSRFDSGVGPTVAPETILGVHAGASVREIDVAWRSYVLAHHPDRGGDSEAFLRGRSARDELLDRARGIEATPDGGPAAHRPPIRGVPARRRLWMRRVRTSLAWAFPTLAPPPSRVD